MSFLLYAIGLGIDLFIKIDYIIKLIFVFLNFVGLFILIGIDREYKQIQTSVLVYLFLINIVYRLLIGWNFMVATSFVILLAIIVLKISNLNNINKNDKFNILTLLIYFLCINNAKRVIVIFIISILINLVILLIQKNRKSKILSLSSILMIVFIVCTIFLN